MSTNGNGSSGKLEDFKPKKGPDPQRLANTTVEAVDHISSTAAEGLRAAAKQLRLGAEDVAKYLEALADDYDREGQRASAEVAAFVNRAVSVHQTALDLAKSLRPEEPVVCNVTTMDDRPLTPAPAELADPAIGSERSKGPLGIC